MGINPYLDDFDDENALKPIENEEINYVGPDGENISPEMQDAFSKLLSNHVDTSSETNYPVEFLGLSRFFEQFYASFDSRPIHPYIMTQHCILNGEEPSENYSKLIEYFKEEISISSLKVLSRSIDNILKTVDKIINKVLINGEEHFFNEVTVYLNVIQDYISFRLNQSIENYIKVSNELNKEIDNNLIEYGIFTEVPIAHYDIIQGTLIRAT